ncbi:MAG: glycosyltransferase [Bryobacteraceae bacterium]
MSSDRYKGEKAGAPRDSLRNPVGFAGGGGSRVSEPAEPKVMTVLTRLGAGGPPVQAVLLLREMSSLGRNWTLVAGSCGKGEADMSYLLRPTDRVCRIPAMTRAVAPHKDAVALWHLYRLFRRERPDLVHTHTAKAGVLGRLAARLAGVPVVLHTFHGNVLSGYFPAPLNQIILLVERLMAGLSDAVCVLSPQQADEISGRFRVAPSDKVRVVPLGLDLAPWRSIGPASDDPARGLTVGWLGRLVPVKDVPLLCAVVRKVVLRLPRVRFLIAGDGTERALVDSLQRECGADRCEFLGWREDVAPVIQRCHLLLLTSRNEGTPISLIQGMAAGRPFLSTPAGGVADMVQGAPVHDSGVTWFENAALCSAEPDSFVRALETLSARPDRLAGMSSACLSVAMRFDVNNLIRTTEQLYSELLQSKASPRLSRVPGLLEALAGFLRTGRAPGALHNPVLSASVKCESNVETVCGRWMK